jgi:histidinol-phosphatase (PHP family)
MSLYPMAEYKTDYHVHTIYSDGRSAPEDYISMAVNAGLSEIGFSDHLNLFSDHSGCDIQPENISKYIEHISSLRNLEKNIKIRIGFEVDYFEGKETETETFLKSLPLDYAIGSVHYMGEMDIDTKPDFYQGKNIDRLFRSYFDSICAAAASGVFDIIGHCDLIRIYGHKPSSDQEPLYRQLARIMKLHNVAFEVNTNGRNRPLADFYPDRKFLHIFHEENVPVCVNSDAHMPMRLGQFFDEAYELLRYTGFTEMAVFEKRVRYMKPF